MLNLYLCNSHIELQNSILETAQDVQLPILANARAACPTIREVKIPRFRCTCTGSMILVSNIFVDVCTFTRN
jgi:hypothetical protein